MFVCPNCFEDMDLQSFVEDEAVSDKCDFCGARSGQPIAAPLETVAEHIAEYLEFEYTDPANSGLPYESAEGGYQETVWTTEELLRDEIELELPRDNDGRLFETLAAAIDDLPDGVGFWAERDPFGLPEQDQLRISWESFTQFVMHQRRFFFRKADLPQEAYEDPDLLAPDELLKRIAERAIDVGLIERLPAGTRIYRARRQGLGVAHATAEALGPPPPESATQNRMSPAGIPMFHGAEDPDTAVVEIYRDPGDYAVGEFVTTRDAWILDLHSVPAVPSFFSKTHGWERHALIFLRTFAKEVSKPIARDDSVHIGYVPTQVLTEYFKTQVTYDGSRIEGVSFMSSRTGRRNYTLFLPKGQADPHLGGEAVRTEPLLRLELATVVRRDEDEPHPQQDMP